MPHGSETSRSYAEPYNLARQNDLADSKFEKKLDKLKNAVKSISALYKVPVQALGSVVGQSMSMGFMGGSRIFREKGSC